MSKIPATGGGKRTGKRDTDAESDEKSRIAIVLGDKCRPKKCQQECKKSCPVVRMGKLCIQVTPKDKIATISEELCIGCNICVKKCPLEAVKIVNLMSNLAGHTTHRYGPNSFKLHRLPMPRQQEILGLVGINGVGKSTALKILSGKIKPNLGRFSNPPDWSEIIKNFRGSELQGFFTKVVEDDIKAIIKPQYVDHIPRAVPEGTTVESMLKKKDQRNLYEEIIVDFDLVKLQNREIGQLSGGELQRFANAFVCVHQAEVYMFDESTSYLDVKQRVAAAKTIRKLREVKDSYILVVEHDLSILDYLSDYVCVLYGMPGAYGVVTLPYSVREGINVFLDGFIPTENLRFRDESLTFKIAETATDETIEAQSVTQYPAMTKTLGQFKLNVEAGSFGRSQIVVMLGENGTGKTTLIRLLAGDKADGEPDDEYVQPPELSISYKPQKISPKFAGSVMALLHLKIPNSYLNPQFISDVIKPLSVDRLYNNTVKDLSGGELQRLAITLCLGTKADVYLLDEPSAYLDSEQRITASKVIKRFILHSKKSAFVVEHDFIMATYLADSVIVYDGMPSVEATARAPEALLSGMNRFLKSLDITFRRDPDNFRPRINKLASVKDQEQKQSGNHFFMDE